MQITSARQVVPRSQGTIKIFHLRMFTCDSCSSQKQKYWMLTVPSSHELTCTAALRMRTKNYHHSLHHALPEKLATLTWSSMISASVAPAEYDGSIHPFRRQSDPNHHPHCALPFCKWSHSRIHKESILYCCPCCTYNKPTAFLIRFYVSGVGSFKVTLTVCLGFQVHISDPCSTTSVVLR